MAIYLKTFEEIELIREVGHTLGVTFKEISRHIKPGVSLLKLDRIAYDFIKESGASPKLKKSQGLNKTSFWSIATWVNDANIDGIIEKEVILLEGDIVKIECQVEKWGFNAKACYTFGVGNLSLEASHLVAQTKKSLDVGISNIKVGLRTGDVVNAIKREAQTLGYRLLGDTLGHGIGRKMIEDPIISSSLKKGMGQQIKVGMALTLGVKLSQCRKETFKEPLVAEALHTIIVGPKGVEVITKGL